MAIFQPGNSGRPKGARNKPRLDRLAAQEAQQQLTTLVGKALDVLAAELDGDDPKARMTAARLVLDKIIPPAKGDDGEGPIYLPELISPDLSHCTRRSVINAAVGEGRITPAQGLTLIKMTEAQPDRTGWEFASGLESDADKETFARLREAAIL